MKSLLVLLWALATGVPVLAQPAQPCGDAHYRDFDFWVGDWDVYTPAGTLAGTNTVSVQEGGCLLLEQWHATAGGSGQSYNFFDPGDGRWHQLWVSGGAIIRYAGGLTKRGSMRLEGEISYQADGRKARFTGEWTPTADGTVVQVFKEWDAAGQQWTDWFTGHYRRRKTP